VHQQQTGTLGAGRRWSSESQDGGGDQLGGARRHWGVGDGGAEVGDAGGIGESALWDRGWCRWPAQGRRMVSACQGRGWCPRGRGSNLGWCPRRRVASSVWKSFQTLVLRTARGREGNKIAGKNFLDLLVI
jgi:hypothetical protein